MSTTALYLAGATSALRVSGEDARDFLHAQFSADLRALDIGTTLVTAWLNPKGRVLFLPRVLRGPDAFFLLLPAAQAPAFAKRLRMFVLRARVQIDDGAERGVLVLHGMPTPSALRADIVGGRDAASGAIYLVGPPRALEDLAVTLGAAPLDADGATLAAIRAGAPLLEATLAEEFLPQELNLDLLAGVSFNKGCYPGQEIVARVKFRGTVKRRAQRWLAVGADCPAPGARLLGADGAPHGTVLAAARGDAGVELLAVTDLDAGTVTLDDAARTPLTALPLPYPLTGA